MTLYKTDTHVVQKRQQLQVGQVLQTGMETVMPLQFHQCQQLHLHRELQQPHYHLSHRLRVPHYLHRLHLRLLHLRHCQCAQVSRQAVDQRQDSI